MNVNLCDLGREAYLDYLRDNFRCRQSRTGLSVLQTPFLTPDNDPITVSIESAGGGRYRLSDRRRAFEFLFLSGVEIGENERRTELVEQILKVFAAQLEHREIVVYGSDSDLGLAMYRLVSAQQQIFDLVFTAQPGALEKSFKMEVGEFFTQAGVHYRPGAHLPGYSVSHTIDFLITEGPARLVETLSAKTSADAKYEAIQTTFKWIDIKRLTPQFRTISIYDDTYPVWEPALSILRNNQTDEIFRWQSRADLLAALKAA